jgi:hypothetical protein
MKHEHTKVARRGAGLQRHDAPVGRAGRRQGVLLAGSSVRPLLLRFIRANRIHPGVFAGAGVDAAMLDLRIAMLDLRIAVL